MMHKDGTMENVRGKKLEEINPADYGMDVETTIAASAVLGYLAFGPKEAARETMGTLVGRSLAGGGDILTREQMQVDTERLVTLIGVSTRFMKKMIEQKVDEAPGTTAEVEHQTQLMLDGLQNFDSERVAGNCQESFLDFLYDCCLAVLD